MLAAERSLGLQIGVTELVPNIELARGLIQTYDICNASPRVKCALVASEDMATDLGAERSRDGEELNMFGPAFTSNVSQLASFPSMRPIPGPTMPAPRPRHATPANSVIPPKARSIRTMRPSSTRFSPPLLRTSRKQSASSPLLNYRKPMARAGSSWMARWSKFPSTGMRKHYLKGRKHYPLIRLAFRYRSRPISPDHGCCHSRHKSPSRRRLCDRPDPWANRSPYKASRRQRRCRPPPSIDPNAL